MPRSHLVPWHEHFLHCFALLWCFSTHSWVTLQLGSEMEQGELEADDSRLPPSQCSGLGKLYWSAVRTPKAINHVCELFLKNKLEKNSFSPLFLLCPFFFCFNPNCLSPHAHAIPALLFILCFSPLPLSVLFQFPTSTVGK